MQLSPKKQLRILDFDIENRPLSYGGMDFTFSDITAIGAQFYGDDEPYVWALGDVDGIVDAEVMLRGFVRLYNIADIVTGHYILGHDLPIINGALMELGMPGLSKKMVSDTKVHLDRSKGVSKSQESLGAMYELDAPKVQMNQPKWREANRLTAEGIALTKERVLGDVVQHMQLRKELLERGWLKPPEEWRP